MTFLIVESCCVVSEIGSVVDDTCFGLVFCRMNKVRAEREGNMMDSQSKHPLVLVTVLYVQFSLLYIHWFSLT